MVRSSKNKDGLVGRAVCCRLLLFRCQPASLGRQGVCNLLSGCFAPVITSGPTGLVPLTLTAREMSPRKEIPTSFGKSHLSKHAGCVPVPETWENKISISNKFFLSLALEMPSSHPAGCRPLRTTPQGFGQGLVKAGGPVMVGLGGRRRRKARYLISSCFLHFCFH